MMRRAVPASLNKCESIAITCARGQPEGAPDREILGCQTRQRKAPNSALHGVGASDRRV